MRVCNIKFVWSIVLALAFVLLSSAPFVVFGQTFDFDAGPSFDGSLESAEVRNNIANNGMSEQQAGTEPGQVLVPCDGVKVKCDFNAFVLMINKIISWIIGIAGVIFAITLIYGGFLYMTSGDNPGNKTKATDMMWNTLKGFVIILTAWLIVYTILKTLAPNYPALFEFIGKN
jgi:hypothetical protein